ncbi:hypothetical protein GGU11DRAFT_790691, partial [Lentinula aff. detonsa]
MCCNRHCPLYFFICVVTSLTAVCFFQSNRARTWLRNLVVYLPCEFIFRHSILVLSFFLRAARVTHILLLSSVRAAHTLSKPSKDIASSLRSVHRTIVFASVPFLLPSLVFFHRCLPVRRPV